MLDRLVFMEADVLRAAAVIFAVSGALFIWWGMWDDRSRGRRRCPKCWYDMKGVPGLVCPECGKSAEREKRLFRARRRRSAVAVGVVLLLLACAAPHSMTWYRHGWRRTLPTWVVLQMTNLNGWPTPANAGSDKWSGELLRRYRSDDLGWSRSAAMRAMAQHWTFEHRRKWPAGAPLHLNFPADRWWENPRIRKNLKARLADGQAGEFSWVSPPDEFFRAFMGSGTLGAGVTVGSPAAGAPPLALEITVERPSGAITVGAPEFEAEWSGRFSLPIEIVTSVDDVLTPVGVGAIASGMSGKTFVDLRRWENPTREVGSIETFIPAIDVPTGMAVALRVELLCDGIVVGEGRALVRGPSVAYNGPEAYVGLEYESLWATAAGYLENAAMLSWAVRIRGDGELALRDLNATSYWSGDVLVPLKVVDRPSTASVSATRERLSTVTLAPAQEPKMGP